MTTLSRSFLKPILKIANSHLNNNGFIDVYIGNFTQTKEEWGQYIYMAFIKSEVQDNFLKAVRKKGNYILEETHYNSEENRDELLIQFSLTDHEKETIIKPFLNGAYSRIDREYVYANFSKEKAEGNTTYISSNWKVLHKDPSLARYWEERIGVKFNNTMEVWSRPSKIIEIYGYQENYGAVGES